MQTLKKGSPPNFKTTSIPKLRGTITDISCGREKSKMYAGSSHGQIFGYDGKKNFYEFTLPGEPYITAIALDEDQKTLWVGTQTQGLYRLQGDQYTHYDAANGLSGNHVLDVEIDKDKSIWVAIENQGLNQLKGDAWQKFTPENSDVLYWSVGNIKKDLQQGIWYLPHIEVRSHGLGYFNGEKGHVFNPAHDILDRPSSLAIDPDGSVWIGSWFDGLHHLEPERSLL